MSHFYFDQYINNEHCLEGLKVIEKQSEIHHEVQSTSVCNCGYCESERKEKNNCQCDHCREKRENKAKVTKRNNCRWHKVDQRREERYQNGKYNKNKFIWEIDCECIDCSK